MTNPGLAWLSAFGFTQAVEVPIYLAVMARQKLDLTWLSRALLAFGVTAFTHPIVFFVLPLTMRAFQAGGLNPNQAWWAYVAVAETFAVGAEAYILAMFSVRRPLLLSFAANGASAGLGLLSRHLFHWP